MKSELLWTLFISLTAVAASLVFAPWDGVSEIVTLRLIYLAFLMTGGFATLYVLRGTKYDTLREVFEEHNVAAAIVVAAILVSIALVIGG